MKSSRRLRILCKRRQQRITRETGGRELYRSSRRSGGAAKAACKSTSTDGAALAIEGKKNEDIIQAVTRGSLLRARRILGTEVNDGESLHNRGNESYSPNQAKPQAINQFGRSGNSASQAWRWSFIDFITSKSCVVLEMDTFIQTLARAQFPRPTKSLQCKRALTQIESMIMDLLCTRCRPLWQKHNERNDIAFVSAQHGVLNEDVRRLPLLLGTCLVLGVGLEDYCHQ